MPAIFCGLKSQIRFYSKLTLIEPELFKTVVLPYNAGNLQQPPQKNTTCRGGRRSTNELNDAMKDCSLSFSRLNDFKFTLLSRSQSLFLVFFTDKPLKKISLEYTGHIFADWKGLKKKQNARQPENFLEFLQNPFFLSFESILIN